ncbi:hypothetical protein YOLOSWAG_30 [Erwinia phage vB_EamM_Yoloswag]|uniref:Uncharacterized protein n=1 Tax=Erwinia phage vB_EamM_Yoloswag TaxID=1958956 RepID=A0A1S6L2V3_9CAUD|nr:hypothetical protein HOR66_gp030 [Erwinia phage vB_EamM_Yoloswag]AQT28515.1 hypothetical protein YOLOSWAG_30 [Erwinia phage vB_EamM_Yoloswag]
MKDETQPIPGIVSPAKLHSILSSLARESERLGREIDITTGIQNNGAQGLCGDLSSVEGIYAEIERLVEVIEGKRRELARVRQGTDHVYIENRVDYLYNKYCGRSAS